LRCLRRNLGRKRSQDSFASFGSLASSRLIISSYPNSRSKIQRVGVNGGTLLSDRLGGCSACNPILCVALP
jgi:hypothetical protein